ncbi:MAG: carboxymuconolactone decarboxylase family protein [Gammaproteobacteria bacterium]|nr:MAG: carboxymuconolactone decarboxylase family protein [Gammaproteobacteria bacterium]
MTDKKRPGLYDRLAAKYPEFINSVEAMGSTAKELGPLDEKSAQLIQLAAAASIRSEGAVHSHTRRAVEAGASAAEIHHALLLLVSTIGFPSVMAALSWADDILDPV